jgi:hypothetical protein
MGRWSFPQAKGCFILLWFVKFKNVLNFKNMLNSKKFLKRRFLFIFAAFLILAVGGFFYWWQVNKEIKGSSDDYAIKETMEGVFVKNKKAGLTVKVPEGWEAEKMDVEEGLVVLYSLDNEIKKKEGKITLPIEKGCLIRIVVIYEKAGLDEIKKGTKLDHLLMGNVIYDEFQEVLVDNYYSLKNSFELEEKGQGISFYTPVKDRVYSFHLVWEFGEKEKCIQEFDEFLETISIL